MTKLINFFQSLNVCMLICAAFIPMNHKSLIHLISFQVTFLSN
ncbi:unnamed protein product, partial [Vitis vinifera]